MAMYMLDKKTNQRKAPAFMTIFSALKFGFKDGLL